MTEATDRSNAIAEPKGHFRLNFITPGFSKCGTTTLYALLNEHPQIRMSTNKEPNLSIQDDYQRYWAAYRSLFPNQLGNLVLGEASTMYSTRPYERASRDRMLRHFPALKLIFIVRDPLKRIESSFREFHHSGHYFGIDADFDANRALRQLPMLLDDSLYYRRLLNYSERVPRERMLIIFLEDLIANTAAELRRCFEFLAVDPTPAVSIPLRAMNTGAEKLRDSKLIRQLRRQPLTHNRIAELDAANNQTTLQALRLRRRFTEQICWRDDSLALIAQTLADDSRRLLALTDHTLAVWPAFARIVEKYCVPTNTP